VVFHGGAPRAATARLRRAGVPILWTVGTAVEARRAVAAGVDGLVAQGLEAGGHLVGVEPLERALPAILEAAGERPVLAAGGVANAADVRRLLAAGASAAVAGTRFLLTAESGAHPAYRARVLAAERTIVTRLFGFGWPMRHRVVPNAATDRWCRDGEGEPGWLRGLGTLSGPLGRALPLGATGRLLGFQRAALPLFSPGLPLAGMPEAAVDRSALYAGETLHRIDGVVDAAQALALLAP
jgi:NAD(P)H-dependent flavin oxidoreductase YrpB (nitropropane dioxygenase family)